jgi:hypothetical protein
MAPRFVATWQLARVSPDGRLNCRPTNVHAVPARATKTPTTQADTINADLLAFIKG